MRKTDPPTYFVCPTHLTMMRLLRGGPLILFRNPCALTPGQSMRITQPSSGSYSGMSYSVTFNSSNSSAPLLKRVLTAYRAALKTSVAPSAATCAKTTEATSSYEHYPFHVRMGRAAGADDDGGLQRWRKEVQYR
jgi:hypothetical protein